MSYFEKALYISFRGQKRAIGYLTIKEKPDEGVDPNKFRQKYRGVKARHSRA